jgi:hypothetical protein
VAVLAGAWSMPLGARPPRTPGAPPAEPEVAVEEVPIVRDSGGIVADAVVVPARDAQLSLATAGIVAEGLVSEGDQVEAGQVLVPLIVPLTLLKHHLNCYPVPEWVPVPSAASVHQQVYLHPYPKELMLRNHV